jgi:hypothetical protein
VEPVYDSYCGLYCGACPVLSANERGDVEKRAAEWKMSPEELRCWGCKTDVTAVFCTDCEIRRCARERGVEFCSACDEYPCDRLTSFAEDEHPHHSVVLKNLEIIESKGLRSWLDERKERWSCPVCGARFTWYDCKCAGCGATTYDCRDEERDLRGS